ncbi:MAG: FAD-dependent oxidoreductase, partial [Lautropia sp.]
MSASASASARARSSEALVLREVADVVVIGGGGAGLSAAVAAAQRGVTTVLLEKASVLGGTTRLAVGSISAAGTRLQRAAGIVDRVDDFRRDMDAFTGSELLPRDNPVLRAMLASEAGTTVDWLERLGVAFAGPYPEPPHRVNRMHNTVPGAATIVARLEAAARRAGLAVHLGSGLHGLITDDAGEVIGVEYSHDGARRLLFARRGVILATGDFSGNADMRTRFLPPAAAKATPINPGNVGDGHHAALAVGAIARNMDMIFGPQMRFPRAPRPSLGERLPPWPWLTRLGAQVFMRAPAWL